MHHCVNCRNVLVAERLHCSACGLTYEGRFGLPRLARLGPAEQDLAERVLLAAGNLKEVARTIEISYPTLRKRLDALILRLRELRETDAARIRELLDEVEAGTRNAEEAARLIEEMSVVV